MLHGLQPPTGMQCRRLQSCLTDQGSISNEWLLCCLSSLCLVLIDLCICSSCVGARLEDISEFVTQLASVMGSSTSSCHRNVLLEPPFVIFLLLPIFHCDRWFLGRFLSLKERSGSFLNHQCCTPLCMFSRHFKLAW